MNPDLRKFLLALFAISIFSFYLLQPLQEPFSSPSNSFASTQTSTTSSPCQKFGPEVFQGKDGACYRCPKGATHTGYNNLKVPTCTRTEYTPMTQTRKTVLPAQDLSIQVKTPSLVAKTLAPAERIGSYYQPVKSMSTVSADQICQQEYSSDSVYDPESNRCLLCPKGLYRTSDNKCRSFLGFQSAPIQRREFPGYACPVGSTPSDSGNSKDRVCYSCPAGYRRNPESPLDSMQACTRECPINTFPDPESGYCLKCPEGYQRNPEAEPSSDSACKAPCPEGSFRLENSGATQCYKCPSGFIREGDLCRQGCPSQAVYRDGKCLFCPNGYTLNPYASGLGDACYKACEENQVEDTVAQSCYSCPENYTPNKKKDVPSDPQACLQRGAEELADLVAYKSSENGKWVNV